MRNVAFLILMMVGLPIFLASCALLTEPGLDGSPSPLAILTDGGIDAVGQAATGDSAGAISAVGGALALAGFAVYKKLSKKKKVK